MGNERRRHPRVPAALPFRLVSEAGEEESFDLVDLSESGARIKCHHAIPAMTRIRVALVLPSQYLEADVDVRVDTTGVVVWSHPLENGLYDTGVFFSELEEDERGMLHSFVSSLV